MDEARLRPLLRLLLVPGMHATAAARLLRRHGDDPGRVLASPMAVLASTKGVGPALAAAVRHGAPPMASALEEERRSRDMGLSLVGPGDAGYPSALIHAWDPPPLLYAKGEWLQRDGAAVALVGARRCSLYGRTQARRLASDLAARRLTVVSGLARGVDTAAHEGALEPGAGRTVAVLGSGLARPYPRENVDLLARVAERGAVLSAFPLDAAPLPHHFPHRNRIIASLALGTVVVEAGARSGSLITARLALEAGRDVMVIPGPVDDPLSLGGHRLLRDGAAPVRDAVEVLEALGMDAEDVPADGGGSSPEGDAGAVLDALSGPARDTDTLVRATGLDVARVRTALIELELGGSVRSFPGGFWGRG